MDTPPVKLIRRITIPADLYDRLERAAHRLRISPEELALALLEAGIPDE